MTEMDKKSISEAARHYLHDQDLEFVHEQDYITRVQDIVYEKGATLKHMLQTASNAEDVIINIFSLVTGHDALDHHRFVWRINQSNSVLYSRLKMRVMQDTTLENVLCFYTLKIVKTLMRFHREIMERVDPFFPEDLRTNSDNDCGSENINWVVVWNGIRGRMAEFPITEFSM